MDAKQILFLSAQSGGHFGRQPQVLVPICRKTPNPPENGRSMEVHLRSAGPPLKVLVRNFRPSTKCNIRPAMLWKHPVGQAQAAGM